MESRNEQFSLKETLLFYEEASGNINLNNYVDISTSKVGRELLSDSFGPCLPVLAILKNGEYGLYHAFARSKNDPLMRFVDLIKGKVEHIFIFQKSFPETNIMKSPFLAIVLARELDCEVKRIHIDGYTGIYANAEKKEVILFKKQSYTDGSDKTNIVFSGTKHEIDVNNYIDMKSTVSGLFNGPKMKYRKSKNDVLFDDEYIIPEKFTYGFFDDANEGHVKNKHKTCAIF